MENGQCPTLWRAHAPHDFRTAALLLARYRQWLAGEVGIDIVAAQPEAGPEFDDPAHVYLPPDGLLVLARLGELPVGLVGVRRLRGPVGELKRMYVSPWARGHGLGRALVAEAADAAIDLGLRDLRLQTKPSAMSVAHRLYRELGFTEIAADDDLGVEGVATMALRR